MVDPDHVDGRERGPDTVDPPLVAALCEDVPPVMGIAPELAGCAEVVRRHTRHDNRITHLIQVENIGMRPDIGTVVCYKDRCIAHDANAAFVRIGLERAPLTEEEELHEALIVDLRGQPLTDFAKRVGVTQPQVTRPAVPGSAAILIFDRSEEGVVLQPECLALHKGSQFRG
jgi:hypothetical protein